MFCMWFGWFVKKPQWSLQFQTLESCQRAQAVPRRREVLFGSSLNYLIGRKTNTSRNAEENFDSVEFLAGKNMISLVACHVPGNMNMPVS